jgi:hypothetical protein
MGGSGLAPGVFYFEANPEVNFLMQADSNGA